MIFYNSNFNLLNKGFISHDYKCAKLLSYSKFFKDNNYSLNVDGLKNNQILIQRKRKLGRKLDTSTQVPEKCEQTEGTGYTTDSISFNLCKKCNYAQKYYKVYDPNLTIYGNGQNFVQCFNNDTKKNFYLNDSEDTSANHDDYDNWVYKPCYETCETCSMGGDAYNHNCDTCALRYKRYNDSKEGKILCEADCSYAYYYTYPLDYYECTESNGCPEEAKYLVPKIKKCVKSCSSAGYPCLYSGKCYSSCSEANAVVDDSDSTGHTCKDKAPVPGGPTCVVSKETFDSDDFINAEGVKTQAQVFANEFGNINTHVNYFSNKDAVLIIYNNYSCITELNIQAPSVDLDDSCDAKIYAYMAQAFPNFNKNTDVIIALVGGASTSKNVKSSFSYFYKNGTYINITQICGSVSVSVTKEIDLAQVDDDAEKIAKQGIDIFDKDSAFYTDVCFMYDSPNGRDATPTDRLNTYYPNISLCETGCTYDEVNLTSFEVSCKCEYSDIMASTGVGEKLMDDAFGEVFEMIENSNIVIFKCGKDVFVAKHFFKNSGSYIILGIMLVQGACVLVYYLKSYNPMLRYLYYLSEYQCSVIEMKNNNNNKGDKNKIKNKDNILSAKLQNKKNPPKKEENLGLKTPAADKLIIDEDEKIPKKLDINTNNNLIDSDNKLMKKKEEKNEKDNLKKNNKTTEKKPMYADKLKNEYDIEMEEYVKTDIDDLEFEDALKTDKRGFCEYFCDRFKEEQIIMDTFFNREALKPMTIKIIILLLNIDLYFVINGLFYSEDYISDLFYKPKNEEGFMDFFPRSLSRFFYCTLVGVIIGIIVDFVSFDEKKVKRLFKRETKNTLQIRYEISVMTKDIKRNYLILMIICGVIGLISLYYVNCFNNVYPNIAVEWIKSSICLMLIIQLLSVLLALLEALIRLLAFKLKSERIYKIKDLLDD